MTSEYYDQTEYMILSLIDKSPKPIGSWTLKELVQLNGQAASTATIGRWLKEMDSQGLTKKSSNKGRVLTDKGEKYLHDIQNLEKRAKLRNDAVEATFVTNLHQLSDLLTVRKCLETETAYQAALKATEDEKNMLRQALKAHQECVMLGRDPTETALKFHLTISKICHNNLLYRLVKLVIYEEDQIEKNIESLVTRERGPSYAADHSSIVEAILSGDADLSKEQMAKHIQTLIDAVNENPDKTQRHQVQ